MARPHLRPIDEAGDIQGLVHSGYGGLTEASYLLLRVVDGGAARRWLTRMLPAITTAAMRDPPVEQVLQVAFTADGLWALGAPAAVLNGFSAEFLSGMAGEVDRSRRLGDVGPNAPANWRWGTGSQTPHLLVVLLAAPGRLASLRAAIAGEDWAGAFQLVAELATADMRGREPFGFIDGISQPTLDWKAERQPGTDADLAFGNLISAGEFLLGYPNEYGRFTDRPLVEAGEDPGNFLKPAADQPSLRDFGRNGSYLVFRQVEQDVRGFWRSMDRLSASEPVARAALAEKIVGRKIEDGEPLAHRSKRAIRGVDEQYNSFDFEDDLAGRRCPAGAHIRRANPRTGDMPGGVQGPVSQLLTMLGLKQHAGDPDLVASSRFHRLLRRGREYGTFLNADDALRQSGEVPETGLHFICLVANIARQFEFVQGAWLMGAAFNGLTGEQDPLVGHRQPLATGLETDAFAIPGEAGPCRRLHLARFVTLRGGAYFFLPGMSALRYLAAQRS